MRALSAGAGVHVYTRMPNVAEAQLRCDGVLQWRGRGINAANFSIAPCNCTTEFADSPPCTTYLLTLFARFRLTPMKHEFNLAAMHAYDGAAI